MSILPQSGHRCHSRADRTQTVLLKGEDLFGIELMEVERGPMPKVRMPKVRW